MPLPVPYEGKQIDSILDATARINIWEGAIRSGKTITSTVPFLEQLADPPGPPALVGYTLRTLRRNVLDPLNEAAPGSVKIRAGAGEADIFGRRCYLYGANNSLSRQALRGVTLGVVYGDEMTLWHEDMLREVLGRLSSPGAKLFGTCNPDVPTHPLKTDYLDRTDLDLRSWQFLLEDNPTLDPSYISSIKSELGPPSSPYYQRFIEGKWVLPGGTIWSAFTEARHVTDEPPIRIDDWYIAVDYGTVNPFVALLIAVSTEEQRIHVAAEWRWDSETEQRQLTDAEYSERVRDWVTGLKVKPRRWIIDPSAASFKTQLWADRIRSVTDADNAVTDGLRTVNSLFHLDHITVDPSCVGLLKEVPSYRFDKDGQPVKADDHGPDALRYGVMGLRQAWARWIRHAA